MFDLNRWMRLNNVTIKGLSKKCDLSEATINTIRRGCRVSENTIIKLCKGMEIPYRMNEWEDSVTKFKSSDFSSISSTDHEFAKYDYGFNSERISSLVKEGMELTVECQDPRATGQGKQHKNIKYVKGTVLSKTKYFALISLDFNSTKIKQCFTWYDLKRCPELNNW